MPHRDPNNYSWFREVLILLMTMLGVAASYAYKVLNGERFSWRTFILQAIVAVFAGWSGAELIKTIEKRFLRKVSGE
ncbi:holin [Providencia vermicola]|uniref:holin n=1 Tax=Providencia vermicola TaxID=333965 RepID=UPI0034D57C86